MAGLFSGKMAFQQVDQYQGYDPLLEKIAEFFDTGIVPVSADETLEIFAFMQAADESKNKGGISIDLASVMAQAKTNQ